MRFFLYPVIACLLAFTAGASPRGNKSISDLCDAPAVFSATICSGESITRVIQNADAAYTYNWYADAAHNVLLATGTSFATPALYTSTDYYVVAVLGSCTAETMITINVTTVIPPIVPNDTNCLITVSYAHPYVRNPQSGYIYNWYAFDGSLVHTGVDYTVTYFNNPNWMHFTVEAVNGSCRSERVEVVVMDVVLIPAYSHDITICKGDVATLIADAYDPSYSYTWYEGDNMSIIGGGQVFTTAPLYIPKTYYLISTFRDCISNPLAVHVNMHIVQPPVADDAFICPGNTAQLSVQNPAAGTTYTWYDDPQGTSILNTGINYTTAPVSTPTTYYVAANDGVCSSVGSTLTPVRVNFPMVDSPIVRISHVDFNEVTFTWQTISGAIGYEVSINGGPFITPSSGITGTTHTVSGLAHEQTITITVRPILATQFCGISVSGHGTAVTFGDGFYVPSAFTPNGDTKNDILKPIVPAGSFVEYFSIYDRWGQRVFTTTKNGEGWDGKIKGKLQPAGTYVWICRYFFAGRREIEQRGTFILLY